MKRTSLLLAAVVGLPLLAAQPVMAQSSANDLFTGFQAKSDDPVDVQAEELETYEEGSQRITLLSGGVTVTRGKTRLTAAQIKLFSPLDSAQADAFTRIEASGSIKATSGDQAVTGQSAVVDMKAQTITVDGGVVLSQGNNVLRGARLVINLTTGRARVEGGTRGLFSPGGANPLRSN